DLISDHSPVIM
ncbi:hypothetical protein EAG_14952, partial [Camponotus floridanus]